MLGRIFVALVACGVLSLAGCPTPEVVKKTDPNSTAATDPNDATDDGGQASGDHTGAGDAEADPNGAVGENDSGRGTDGNQTTSGGEDGGAGASGHATGGGGGAGGAGGAGAGTGVNTGGGTNGGGGGNTGGGNNGGGNNGGGNTGGGPPTIGGESELAFIEAMTVAGRNAREIADNRVPNAIYFAFVAGNQTGQGVTFAGTLQLSATWSVLGYDPAPSNRLVVVDPNGPVEFTYEAFDGNWSGVAAFTDYHTNLTFRVATATENVRIVSSNNYGNFTRRCTGTITLPRGTADVDIVEGGGEYADSEVKTAWFNSTWEVGGASSIRGTVQAAGGSVNVFEVFDSKMVNLVLRTKIGVGSTGTYNGAAYQLQDVYFQFVLLGANVLEPDYWVIQGGLERGGVAIGICKFNGAVVADRYAPPRVLELVNGTLIGM